MRISSLTFAAALIGVCAIPCLAADRTVAPPGGEPSYVIPAGSPLTANPVYGTGEDITATFPGDFVLTGTFHVAGDPTAPEIFLKPDRDIAARLPRRKGDGAPDEIWFDNEDAALAAIAPPAVLAAIKAGKRNPWNTHVALDVDHFQIQIDCDVATYSVHFVKVHAPDARVAANIKPHEGC